MNNSIFQESHEKGSEEIYPWREYDILPFWLVKNWYQLMWLLLGEQWRLKRWIRYEKS